MKLGEPVEFEGDANKASIDANNKKKYLVELSRKEIVNIENITIDYLRLYDYEIHNSNINKVNISKYKKTYWQLLDIFNLVKYNIIKYGFNRGLIKILKGARYQ